MTDNSFTRRSLLVLDAAGIICMMTDIRVPKVSVSYVIPLFHVRAPCEQPKGNSTDDPMMASFNKALIA